MLTVNVLNQNASLNSFAVEGVQSFIPGNYLVMQLQLFDDVEQLRYIPPSTAVVSLIFNNSDGTTLTASVSLNSNDRSMGTVTLSSAQTALLVGGNALLNVDMLGDQTQIVQGLCENILQKVTIDS